MRQSTQNKWCAFKLQFAWVARIVSVLAALFCVGNMMSMWKSPWCRLTFKVNTTVDQLWLKSHMQRLYQTFLGDISSLFLHTGPLKQTIFQSVFPADHSSSAQHHDQEGVHQHQGALAPAQRQHGLRRAPQAHPHPPAGEEAEQERDPAPGHALHQLPGAAAGEPERPAGRPLPRCSAHPPPREHGAAPVASALLGPGQRHRGALARLQLRQFRGLVAKRNHVRVSDSPSHGLVLPAGGTSPHFLSPACCREGLSWLCFSAGVATSRSHLRTLKAMRWPQHWNLTCWLEMYLWMDV